MKGRERWRQGKAKRSRGEQRVGGGEGGKMVYRICAVDFRVLVWPRAPSCSSMDGVVSFTEARQANINSLFMAFPAISCRMWNPAQAAAAQVVLPSACSLRVITGDWQKFLYLSCPGTQKAWKKLIRFARQRISASHGEASREEKERTGRTKRTSSCVHTSCTHR